MMPITFDMYRSVIFECYANDRFLATQGARHAMLDVWKAPNAKTFITMQRWQGDTIIIAQADVKLHGVSQKLDMQQIEGGVAYCLRGMRNLTTSEAIEAAERRRCDPTYRPHPSWMRERMGMYL